MPPPLSSPNVPGALGLSLPMHTHVCVLGGPRSIPTLWSPRAASPDGAGQSSSPPDAVWVGAALVSGHGACPSWASRTQGTGGRSSQAISLCAFPSPHLSFWRAEAHRCVCAHGCSFIHPWRALLCLHRGSRPRVRVQVRRQSLCSSGVTPAGRRALSNDKLNSWLIHRPCPEGWAQR